MQINYNVTGEKRKSLVGAISQELNVPIKYLGAPTFTYEVGSYHIDKNGTVTGPDNLDLENALHQQGFDTEEREYDEPDRLTIEMPRSAFTDAALENLKRLVESKTNLIKKALGTETLKLEITDDKVRFPWFEDGTDPDAVKACTHFVTALCDMAKTQQRVSATERPVDNEKYALRCFLLRLGFIGAEYKEERKILLSKLTGSSAFKNPVAGGADNE
ncbi:virulence protein [Caproicibacterium amylolyticum]|uniref:Virulence protein n=1 Tax=Caproicibacterium amylolyticum TaxID=2766537 RepID=A0A7G9WGT1_9FIRM|nr:virulence protein [Caproicibacterium amylolyticum]QNO17893.1 virulence protein [Caproicibacterium amylolyticum]